MKKLLTILLLSVVALALTTGEAYACRKVTVRQGMDYQKAIVRASASAQPSGGQPPEGYEPTSE